MIPGMGAFWLGIIAGMWEIDSGKFCRVVVSFMAVMMIVFCIRDYWAFRGNELYRKVNMKQTEQLFDELSDSSQEDLVIICNFDHVCGLLSYYLGERHDMSNLPVLLYEAEPEKLITRMLGNAGTIEGASEIKKLLSEGKRVLFMGSFNSREDIIKDWKDNYNIENENKGSYLLERYWFDVFELSL